MVKGSKALLTVFATSGLMVAASVAPSLAATNSVPTNTGNFGVFGYDYQQTRHVPYDQVTKSNVSDLGLVFSDNLMKQDKAIPGGTENYPIEVNGVLYVTTSFDQVFAINAASGKILWHWKPTNIGSFRNFGLNSNRGVAYGEGKLYLLTLDMHLVAIDAKTGKTVKNISLPDTIQGATTANGYYETTAPIYYNGNVYVGSSGSDNGARGFFMAYKASNLTPAWSQPFWPVPPRGQGWMKNGKYDGGGAVWMPTAIDPSTNTLYFAVGNPAPDYYGAVRPGSDKWTDSVVAVNASTGKLIWGAQEISHDLWDYDAAAPPMVLNATVHGKRQKIVVEGGKSGQWWAWDAKTGKTIYDGVPFVKIKHSPPTPQGVMEWPGSLGGENYAPETYDPGTNYVLIPGVNDPMILSSSKSAKALANSEKIPGALDFGTSMGIASGVTPTGTITAINLNTGKVAYQVDTSTPMRGGFTSTATGLAFFGDGNGYINAMDTKTGKVLWTFQTGAPIASAPAIYDLNGKEYVAVTVGGGGGSTPAMDTVEVFALGGSHVQYQQPTQQSAASQDPHAAKYAATTGKWIAAAAAPKTADLLLIGGYKGANNGMSFDGYGNGKMKVTVPLGWTVNVELKNASGQMPHSAMIVPTSTKGKVSGFKLAFPGASTPNPTEGLAPGSNASQSFTFKADKAGTYLIWCAIPGHGVAGMYDTLVVSSSAKSPSVSY